MMRIGALVAMALAAGAAMVPARAQTLIEAWPTVALPPAPELRAVTLDPATTALLMLDFMPSNCGRRPRCVASLPRVAELAAAARARGAAVVHSVINNTTPADILPQVAAAPGEPWVLAGPNKFLGSELEAILRGRGIRTVIVVGTAAHGAVLNTAAHAALRGFDVVLPVDGMSADTAWPELYVAWHMANGPSIGPRTTLTETGRIGWR
jgi:nicotinamidase-related amidase